MTPIGQAPLDVVAPRTGNRHLGTDAKYVEVPFGNLKFEPSQGNSASSAAANSVSANDHEQHRAAAHDGGLTESDDGFHLLGHSLDRSRAAARAWLLDAASPPAHTERSPSP